MCLTHCLIHSLPHSLVSFTRRITHCLIHSLPHSLIVSFIHCLILSLPRSLLARTAETEAPRWRPTRNRQVNLQWACEHTCRFRLMRADSASCRRKPGHCPSGLTISQTRLFRRTYIHQRDTAAMGILNSGMALTVAYHGVGLTALTVGISTSSIGGQHQFIINGKFSQK